MLLQQKNNPYRRYRGKQKWYRSWDQVSRMILALLAVCLVAGMVIIVIRGRNSRTIPARYAVLSANEPSYPTCALEGIADYAGSDVIVLNDNQPNFTAYDLEHITGENYAELDALGRCGSAVAMLDRSMMPTEPRGEIGHIRPTGWVQEKYEDVIDSDPPYLYNRSHLLAYALTGENANAQNLITGTRHMNTVTMLPYEEEVMQYLDDTRNHVLYRVTPYFKGKELLARGVEMEAYSVEDYGRGVCFHVFVYNVQPGIRINYRTGESDRD